MIEDDGKRYISLNPDEAALVFRTDGFQPLLPLDGDPTNINRVYAESLLTMLSDDGFCEELYDVYVSLLDDRMIDVVRQLANGDLDIIDELKKIETDKPTKKSKKKSKSKKKRADLTEYEKMSLKDVTNRIKDILNGKDV